MRRLGILLFGLGLACAGGDAEDTGSEAEAGSEVCDAYVDCAAEADPAQVAALADAYGAGGSCWSGSAGDDTCEAACEAGLEAYQAANPDADGCFDGVGTIGDQPLRAGGWRLGFEVEEGACADANSYFRNDWDEMEIDDVDPAAGTFRLLAGVVFEDFFDCTAEGRSFACRGEFTGTGAGDLDVRLDGRGDDDGAGAEGDFTLEGNGECSVRGTFEASRD